MFCVKESPIHGRGLFAMTTISAGTVIGRLQGRWTDAEGPYTLWIDSEKGFEVTCDLRFVNHDDDPNAAYYDDLTLVALDDIHPGEEITHDYGDDGAFESESAA